LPDTKVSNPRRSTRVPTGVAADVLIEIRGERHAYAGEAVTVSLHGALIKITAPFKLGDHITLYVHRTRRSIGARVVFADFAASLFGVELDGPENVWGMASTPADWTASPS
jgi:hypothetical protein